ncbi:MAG: MBL fold metallo-hydrolase [Chloroflexi bacterium]|nr:MBL fold metallo-hydrolase [Chloroflexota bacterium]
MITVTEIEGVHRILMARAIAGHPLYFTAAYWVDGLLIDTGCAHTALELSSAMAGVPIAQIVNTHDHEDHIGGNAQLQRTRGVRIFAHPETLPILENPRLLRLQPYRILFWGWPQPSCGEPIGEWVETEHHRFQIIPTPGHAPGHVCLYEPDRKWLFSGDLYIGGKDRVLRLDYNVYTIIASLKKIAQLPLTRLFAGSGTVRDDPGSDIREKIEYLEGLGEEIRRLHNSGMSVAAIRDRLFGSESLIRYVTLGHFSSTNLIRSYLENQSSTSA